MRKIVINTPNAKSENDLSDVIFKPKPLSYISIVNGDIDKLTRETSETEALLINGISFASNDPGAIDENGRNFDFCIAYNDDDSRPSDECLAVIEKHIRDYGDYIVGINPPFIKNTVGSPQCPTVTIALNRELYLKDSKGKMRSSAYKLNHHLSYLYRLLHAKKESTEYPA